jgi:hypothetical protein
MKVRSPQVQKRQTASCARPLPLVPLLRASCRRMPIALEKCSSNESVNLAQRFVMRWFRPEF